MSKVVHSCSISVDELSKKNGILKLSQDIEKVEKTQSIMLVVLLCVPKSKLKVKSEDQENFFRAMYDKEIEQIIAFFEEPKFSYFANLKISEDEMDYIYPMIFKVRY